MVNNSSIVNINGNRYDTKTGKLLPSEITTIKSTLPQNKGLVMDGVMRSPTKHKSANVVSANVIVNKTTLSTPKPIKSVNNLHRGTSHAQTLNRKVVTKPTPKPQIHNHSKVSPSVSIPIPPSTNLVAGVDPERESRAQRAKRSRMVQKFTPVFTKKAVEPTTKAVQGEVINKRDMTLNQVQAGGIPPVLPSTISSATHGNIDELVDHALNSATSHKQKKIKKSHFIKRTPKLISVGLTMLIVVILGGFFAYQYIPNVAMRVANTRAGIEANLPGYQPSGFDFNGIYTSPGTVVISYSSNGDNQRQFKVMQKSSNWDSQSLLSNYVSQQSKNYQTFNEDGKTIYMYSSNSATWVNKGIWYVVEGGTADLNSDQLLKIASSI